jgi:hypothetical protein
MTTLIHLNLTTFPATLNKMNKELSLPQAALSTFVREGRRGLFKE